MKQGTVILVLALAACGGNHEQFGSGDDDSDASVGGSNAQGGGAVATGGGGSGTMSSGSGGGGNGGQIYDPEQDGPYDYAEIDEQVLVPATGNTVAVHAAYPHDAAGPFPVVLMGHGFQLPPTQYYGYVRRLATFGYVALTVDFQAGFISANNVANAQELLQGIDWVAAHGVLSAIADVDNVGTSGHSLGGKVALLAATMDQRVKASVTLDPVDGSMNCSPSDCPDVSELMPLPIPTAFLGETLDATGSFQACAPAADNFTTFYANTSAPSLSFELLGAGHMSFLDDLASCGFTCGFCNEPTVANDVVTNISRAVVVAFYERHLKGNEGYDTYLTGSEAQTRYVDTGLALVASK